MRLIRDQLWSLTARLVPDVAEAALLAALPSDLPDGRGLGDAVRALEQGFYLTNLCKPEVDFDGSIEQRLKRICAELREHQTFSPSTNVFAVTVFDDHLIAGDPGRNGYYDSEDLKFWRVPYVYGQDGDIAFGDAVPVDVAYVYRAVSDSEEAGEETPLEMATSSPLKTDGGKKYGRGAYLIVGDESLPSTWKVRVEETPGKVTAAQLGRAHAALTKGFRGNKVEASAAEIAAAKRKLKKMYAERDLPWPEAQEVVPEPAVLLAATEAAEDQILQGQHSTRMLVQADDAESGILQVSGVATVADVLNAMGQVYPLAVWEENLPRLERMVTEGRLVGEMQHPEAATLDRTCIQYTRIWIEGNEVKFEAKILPTEAGRVLQTLVRNGVAVDISSRGRGRMKTETWNGLPNVSVVQSGFRCDAFDGVLSGASPGAGIHGWLGQSASDNPEEDMPELMETVTALGAQVAALSANQEKLTEILAGLSIAQAAPPAPAPEPAPVPAPSPAPLAQAQNPGVAVMEQHFIRTQFQETYNQKAQEWGSQWANVLRKHFEAQNVRSLEEFEPAIQRAIELTEMARGEAPTYPSMGHQVQRDVGQRGPQSPAEAIEALLDGIPDNPVASAHASSFMPSYMQSQRKQLRKLLWNIAETQCEGWDGKAAIQGYVQHLQGYGRDVINENWMNQACASGCTAVGAGGAPASAIFIFALVRQVFPKLIATEIAGIQPMDKPDGKIFYLTAERLDALGYVDASGATVSGRMPIDRSDSWSDSYANDPGECSTSQRIQMRLAARTVTAQTKKLHSCWSVELAQDLQAYHSLDAGMELTRFLAMEVALEWNQIMLSEMLAGATAGTLTYGAALPSGYTGLEWEQYLSRYVDAGSNKIFAKRHGDITHVVGGPDAILRLGAGYRSTVDPRSGPDPDGFAGVTYAPWASMGLSTPGVKVYKTSFWAGTAFANKLLLIRKGQEWADTGYVWAPYIDYVSPRLVLPDTMQNQQGIMSRAGHQVVVGDTMAVINITSATGQPFNTPA